MNEWQTLYTVKPNPRLTGFRIACDVNPNAVRIQLYDGLPVRSEDSS